MIRRLANFLPTRLLAASLVVLSLAGCAMWRERDSRLGRTTFDSPLVVLPARLVGNQLIVDVMSGRRGPYHFLIDTGSSVTLVSPEFARLNRHEDRIRDGTPHFVVAGADGRTTTLPSATIRRIDAGDMLVEEIPVVVYDFAVLSAHFGQKIDGILGFPFFQHAVLTLDYPQSRIVLTQPENQPLTPGQSLPFSNSQKTPIIQARLGDTLFDVLVDSANDAAVSLNPLALEPQFVVPPRQAGTVETLAGPRPQRIGRLAGTIQLGSFALEQPIVDITDGLSSIGAGTLKHFTVTFDQTRGRATFHRPPPGTVTFESRRSAGMSFTKRPAYWQVASVVPNSPAASAGVRTGDLITHIDGEPVSAWNILRFEQLVRSAPDISYTFLNGRQETRRQLGVVDLVP